MLFGAQCTEHLRWAVDRAFSGTMLPLAVVSWYYTWFSSTPSTSAGNGKIWMLFIKQKGWKLLQQPGWWAQQGGERSGPVTCRLSSKCRCFKSSLRRVLENFSPEKTVASCQKNVPFPLGPSSVSSSVVEQWKELTTKGFKDKLKQRVCNNLTCKFYFEVVFMLKFPSQKEETGGWILAWKRSTLRRIVCVHLAVGFARYTSTLSLCWDRTAASCSVVWIKNRYCSPGLKNTWHFLVTTVRNGCTELCGCCYSFCCVWP